MWDSRSDLLAFLGFAVLPAREIARGGRLKNWLPAAGSPSSPSPVFDAIETQFTWVINQSLYVEIAMARTKDAAGAPSFVLRNPATRQMSPSSKSAKSSVSRLSGKLDLLKILLRHSD